MQNSHLLHSFLETVQLHFKTKTYITTQKISTIKKSQQLKSKWWMGKLANVTINNFCQVFISYKQVIRCYDMRSVPVHTKAFVLPFKIKENSWVCSHWPMGIRNHKYRQATINMTPSTAGHFKKWQRKSHLKGNTSSTTTHHICAIIIIKKAWEEIWLSVKPAALFSVCSSLSVKLVSI